MVAQQNEAAALTVAVAKPVERRWPETVPASGWLKPWHEAIIAAEIDGLRVIDVLVDVGSVVSKGQPLVRLADESVRAELRNQEAALAGAEAALAKARANADRARKIQGSGALSDEKISEYLIGVDAPRGLPANRLHERHSPADLPPVRHNSRSGGSRLTGRCPPTDTDDGRLPDEGASRRSERRPDHARLYSPRQNLLALS